MHVFPVICLLTVKTRSTALMEEKRAGNFEVYVFSLSIFSLLITSQQCETDFLFFFFPGWKGDLHQETNYNLNCRTCLVPLGWGKKRSQTSSIKRCQQLSFPKLLVGVREMKYHTNVQWALLLYRGLVDGNCDPSVLWTCNTRASLMWGYMRSCPFAFQVSCSFRLVCFAVSDCARTTGIG